MIRKAALLGEQARKDAEEQAERATAERAQKAAEEQAKRNVEEYRPPAGALRVAVLVALRSPGEWDFKTASAAPGGVAWRNPRPVGASARGAALGCHLATPPQKTGARERSSEHPPRPNINWKAIDSAVVSGEYDGPAGPLACCVGEGIPAVEFVWYQCLLP
jgi:hypothetical protein